MLDTLAFSVVYSSNSKLLDMTLPTHPPPHTQSTLEMYRRGHERVGWCQEVGGKGVWGHADIDNMLSFFLEKEEEAERGWHSLIYSFHQCLLIAC